MNQAVGTICQGFETGQGHPAGPNGVPKLSVNGPWLGGGGHRRNQPYRTFGKSADFVGNAGPAKIWVLIDEEARSLNDAGFGFIMSSQEWVDYPGTYHNMGAGVAFADGHSEIRRWKDARTKAPTPVTRTSCTGSVDWQWMNERTSARAQ